MSGRTDPAAADTLEHSSDDSDESWLSIMDRLLDEGVDRSEAIQLTAEELSIDVPARFGEDPPRARWRFDGTVRVTIDGNRAPLAAWIRLWESNRSE
ncbi:hypothetical protein [Halalkalirubrum salinum]|uniref:hypothetical protein n=1 Tax=Halalkalirubrum salinum TaxID=2563889 RepID=UPI0010FB17BB|nr:hypothetical protein [Halalkalirubrum salinum]